VKTAARPTDGGYLISGTKRYITNAPLADAFTVMARTASDTADASGVSAFIVDAKSDGITIGKPEKKMGQQGTKVSDVIFSDCFVPTENLIGGVEGMGFKTAMKVLDRGRIHISAVCIGVAKRLIQESLNYSSDRKQFGKPIIGHQLVQALISDSITESLAAEALMLSVARDYDDGKDIKLEAAAAKMFASEMVGRVADRAVQVHGGAGYISEYAVERFYRDVRLFRIYEGTTQIQQLVIAREAMRRIAV
jgi:acyl-CoA dehydrogenase